MAKRRRLTAPDKAALEEIDRGFAAKPKTGISPPIAQVAAETAALSGLAGVGDRVEIARDTADAEKWRVLNKSGHAVERLSLGEISIEHLQRDRLEFNPEAQNELLQSILAHGLRAPIEVVKTEEGYGLISGYRRFLAFQTLAQTDELFLAIPAFVRDHESSISAYVNMVEENEIRANLSHYERGRIAVLAVQQGVFPTIDQAVNILFGTASKAKRSKIRSFATIHENLGDLLLFPVALTEKLGLRLAKALKDGGQAELRNALDRSASTSPEVEAKLLASVLTVIETNTPTSKNVGRPKEVEYLPIRSLKSGGTLGARVSHEKLVLELRGLEISLDDAKAALDAFQKFME